MKIIETFHDLDATLIACAYVSQLNRTMKLNAKMQGKVTWRAYPAFAEQYLRQ